MHTEARVVSKWNVVCNGLILRALGHKTGVQEIPEYCTKRALSTFIGLQAIKTNHKLVGSCRPVINLEV
jgi:hypothetical protein